MLPLLLFAQLASSTCQSSEQIHEDCIWTALESNSIESAYNLSLSLIFNNQTFSDPFKDKLKQKVTLLDSLIAKAQKWGKFQILSPAFQWAQSASAVYLDIKFSHRLESGACSDLKDMVVDYTQDSFYFTAKCTRSSQKLKLLLDFELYAKIDPENSSYTVSKAGRMNVVLKKLEESVWKLPMKGKKVHNMHIWWEMKEKYEKEVSKLAGEDEPAKDQFDDLVNNPNVVIENSYINGKYVDNSKERGAK